MKRLPLALLVASLACCSFVQAQTSTPAAAQPAAKPVTKEAPKSAKPVVKKEAPSEEKAKTDAMVQAGEPGPQHKLLAQFEGTWTDELKQLGPDGAVLSSDKGTTTCKMVMGGRFLESDHEGRYKGRFTHGGGMMGYNNAEKRVESTWADSLGTAINFSTGSFDAEGKVLTLTSEYTGPDGKKAAMKQVTKWTGTDTYTSEFIDAKGVKVMQIDYVRAAAAAKAAPKDGQRNLQDEMRAAQDAEKKALEKAKQQKTAPK